MNISENYGEYISNYAIYPLYKHQGNIIIGIKNILVEPLIYIGIDLDFKYKKETLNTLVVAIYWHTCTSKCIFSSDIKNMSTCYAYFISRSAVNV